MMDRKEILKGLFGRLSRGESMEEVRAEREAAEGAWSGASMRLEFADDLRAALNGDKS